MGYLFNAKDKKRHQELVFTTVIGKFKQSLPNVNSEVTPRVTLAGIASGLIQNEIQDITTMSAEGM